MIERCRNEFPVRMMCRLMKVSSSGYYGWSGRPLSLRTQENIRLLRQIRAIHTESDGVYGSPKIWEELLHQDKRVGVNRVARLMRKDGLQGIPAKKRWHRRKSGDRPDGIQNHLRRDFDTETPNGKWATDITYIRTGEGWLYLAAVIDLFSRQVIGWSMQNHMSKDLVVQAVLMALWQRKDAEAVILHSDRGSQYTSYEYKAFLKEHNVISSMSAVGSCYDNAAMESFFGLLKRERVNRKTYTTRAEARADVFDYIERFYNRKRRHSYNDGLPPVRYAENYSNSLN